MSEMFLRFLSAKADHINKIYGKKVVTADEGNGCYIIRVGLQKYKYAQCITQLFFKKGENAMNSLRSIQTFVEVLRDGLI